MKTQQSKKVVVFPSGEFSVSYIEKLTKFIKADNQKRKIKARKRKKI